MSILAEITVNCCGTDHIIQVLDPEDAKYYKEGELLIGPRGHGIYFDGHPLYASEKALIEMGAETPACFKRIEESVTYMDPYLYNDDEIIVSVCSMQDVRGYYCEKNVLSLAARHSHSLRTIELLLDPLDINCFHPVIFEMLCEAASRGWLELVEFLVNHEYFNKFDKEKQLQWISVSAKKANLMGKDDVIEFLVSKGAARPDPKIRGRQPFKIWATTPRW